MKLFNSLPFNSVFYVITSCGWFSVTKYTSDYIHRRNMEIVGGMQATEQSYMHSSCSLMFISHPLTKINESVKTFYTSSTQKGFERQHCLLLREVVHKTPHFGNRCKKRSSDQNPITCTSKMWCFVYHFFYSRQCCLLNACVLNVGCTDRNAHTSPTNSTWFTRPFLGEV